MISIEQGTVPCFTLFYGLPELRLADMVEDMDTLHLCRDCADTILADDPNLDKPENQPLLTETQDLFRRSTT